MHALPAPAQAKTTRIAAITQDSRALGGVDLPTADRRVRGNGAARRSLVDFALRIRCGRQQRERRHNCQPPSDDHVVPPQLKDAKEAGSCDE